MTTTRCTTKCTRSSRKINTLMDGIQQGEGTVGKFMKDPALL